MIEMLILSITVLFLLGMIWHDEKPREQ